MEFNPFSSLKIDRWFHVIIIVSSITLIFSLTVEMQGVDNVIVQLFSLGFLLFSIGEWINFTTETAIEGHFKITTFQK